MRNLLTPIAALFIAMLLAGGAFAQAIGDKARLSHVRTFDGTHFDPKSIEGKPTLLYFWASWCPICRREMVQLEKHYQTYREKGFNVIAINFRDEDRKARAMIEAIKPISFVVGTIDDKWSTDYPSLKGTPTWYLLDKQGVIRKVIVGQEVISGGWFDGLVADLKNLTSE